MRRLRRVRQRIPQVRNPALPVSLQASRLNNHREFPVNRRLPAECRPARQERLRVHPEHQVFLLPEPALLPP
jgi:hypothetical protein